MQNHLAVVQNNTVPAKRKILMIDLENCPNEIGQLTRHLDQYDKVIICYAKSSQKIPLDDVSLFATAFRENRLELKKMPNGGKNSADFGISFWAGHLIGQFDVPDIHVDIMSDDADLNHVVSLLREQKHQAERVPKTNKPCPKLSAEKALSSQAEKYSSHLHAHPKNRPVKKNVPVKQHQSAFKHFRIRLGENFQGAF